MPVLFQFLWIRNLAKPQTLCLGSHRTGIKVWPGLGFHLGAQKGENPLEAQSSFPHGGRVGFSSCWLLAGGYVHTQRLPVVLVTWSLFLRDHFLHQGETLGYTCQQEVSCITSCTHGSAPTLLPHSEGEGIAHRQERQEGELWGLL